MGANIPGEMTAGDLIRSALNDGATELGLAKRLAGNTSDSDVEVKRWRYIVRRARRGAEPRDDKIRRIAETFGADPTALERRRDQASQRPDRLAALEEQVAQLMAQRDDVLPAIVQRLADLEAAQELLAQRLDQQQTAAR